jgi:cystathionine gamma-synthase
VALAGVEGKGCLLFSSPEATETCKEYASSSARGENALSADDISIRIFDIDVRYYAILFPAAKAPEIQPFWTNSGVGVSSRLAEESMKHIELLHEVTDPSSPAPKLEDIPAHAQLRERIAGLMERAPVGPPRQAKVSPDDVYLYQTGMAGIYNVHQYLLSRFNTTTVLFGFAFNHTPHVFEDFGPGYKHIGGLSTPEEYEELEEHLKTKAKEGKKVQAVWTEFPSNPLIVTSDLTRLRKLADECEFVLIVDDTVGSFCNVDVLETADIMVTSLTKSFSGYADVMGASAVLNPSSKIYHELKSMFKELYKNEYCNGDAETMEHNSRDYMSRSMILNNNALRLVEYLHGLTSDPKSCVAKVWYPTVNPDLPNYEVTIRKKTEDFTPGYGCLFTVEFKTVDATIAFYDNLNVHHGPHLGAHLTLALPYVKALYNKDLEWAGKYGLKDTQIRISVGLEDTKELLDIFKEAIAVADAIKKERT